MLLKRLLFISFLLLLSSYTFGFQLTNTSDSLEIKKANLLLKKAFKAGRKSNYDSCKMYLENSRKIFSKYENWEGYIKSIYYLGNVYRLNDKPDSAISIYNKSLLELNKVSGKKLNKANIKILNNLGFCYFQKRDYIKAIDYYNQSFSFLPIVGESFEIGDAYNKLAYLYLNIYDLDKAEEFFKKSYIIRKNYDFHIVAEAAYFDNLGSTYFFKNMLEKSLETFLKAKKLYNKGNYIIGVLECQYFISEIYRKQKKYTKALEIAKSGLELAHENSDKKRIHYKFIKLYNTQAKTYCDTKQYEKSKQSFINGLKWAKSKNHSLVHLYRGDPYQGLKQYDSALICYQKGLIHMQSQFENSDVYVNPPLTHISNKWRFLWTLRSKAKAFHDKYFYEASKNIKDLQAAYETNQVALQLVDIMLNNYESAATRLTWSDFMRSIYYQSIIINKALYKATGEEKYRIQAFEIAEKSKAGVLMADMKSVDAKHFGGIPDSLLTKERDIRISLSYEKSRLQSEQGKKEKQDTLKVNQSKEKIFVLNREREALEELFEKQFPKYHELKYDKTQPSIQQIQNGLDANTTLIEYFVGDSSMYAFTITKNNYQVKELALIDSLGAKAQSLPAFLQEKDKAGFSKASYELYQKLFEPLNISTPNLIIIPDGALWQLNFDLLLSQKPEKLDYRKFQYLIKDYTISYAYSAKLLNQEVGQRIQPAKNECLAFSYNNPDDISVGSYIAMRGFRDENLGDLPGTRKEIKAVSSVVDGAYYYGSFANEKNFKEKAKDYNILHMALHGVIDNEDPMNSKLYFTQNKDTLEDNYLHAYELYNLELNAELAVLSACKTGSGKLIKGEGVMSLGRAFTYAGCKSLLLSQWDVSDAFTPQLMKSFYQNLKEGQNKAAALRAAKLEYLSQADNLTSNPYYWAPLVQLGDNKPLKQDSNVPYIMGMVGVLLGIIGIFLYLRRKK